ncbi:fasciclin domain-containing protein [Salegentibacter chungangensis]|uniref:Fasciclin domain-containing protein n=1 Tax=Salegentibacter chungangensis TaxID=1335724 RepID=A0ABW3NUM7_9FLAO
MKTIKLFTLLLIAGFTLASCGDNKKEEEEKARMEKMEAERAAEMKAEKERMEMESNSIAAKAMETDTLSTLVSALKSAQLAETFKTEEGPYTVFAPTNAAFEKVDKATLDTLMKKENSQKLATLLKYHVVEDEVMAADLVQLIDDNEGEYEITTLDGGKLTAMKDGENVVLKDENGNTATIVQTDIDASNGVIHLIDGVVMKKKEN